MVTLTEWCGLLKELGVSLTRKEIRDIIVEECLLTPRKEAWGPWIVDGDRVWKRFIENDPICKDNAEKLRLKSYLSVESLMEERKYRAMRSTFPGKRKKR